MHIANKASLLMEGNYFIDCNLNSYGHFRKNLPVGIKDQGEFGWFSLNHLKQKNPWNHQNAVQCSYLFFSSIKKENWDVGLSNHISKFSGLISLCPFILLSYKKSFISNFIRNHDIFLILLWNSEWGILHSQSYSDFLFYWLLNCS